MAKPTAKLAWNGPPIIFLGWRSDALVYFGAFQTADTLDFVVERNPSFEIRVFNIASIAKDLRSWLEEKGQSKDEISYHLMNLGQTMALV